jgi:hypothetical protein
MIMQLLLPLCFWHISSVENHQPSYQSRRGTHIFHLIRLYNMLHAMIEKRDRVTRKQHDWVASQPKLFSNPHNWCRTVLLISPILSRVRTWVTTNVVSCHQQPRSKHCWKPAMQLKCFAGRFVWWSVFNIWGFWISRRIFSFVDSR